MKDTSSGVAFSAAKIRSPSFSRSASSTTTTGRPARDPVECPLDGGERPRSRAVTATVPDHEPLDVLRHHVHLEVDGIPHGARTECGVRQGRGISATENVAPSVPATVSDTPSTVIDPFSTTYRVRWAGRLKRSSSLRYAGVALHRLPTPSTWPCTMCPPRRPPTATARSRLTGTGPHAGQAGPRQGLGHHSTRNVPPGPSAAGRRASTAVT